MSVSALKEHLKKIPAFPWVMDAARHLVHPRIQNLLWKDYRKTRRDAAFMRRHTFPQEPGKLVLLASLTDSIYQVKLEAMLAMGLMMKGWRPVVLTTRTHNWVHRYFKAFGIADFIFWEDVPITRDEKREAARDVLTWLDRERTFRSVKEWTYRGAWVGPQIISSVARRNHFAAPDVTDPVVWSEIARLLPAVLGGVHRARHLLERLKPKMIIMNETNGPVMGPLCDLAMAGRVDVVQFMQPFRDDALVFKRITLATRRMHPNSLAPETMRGLSQKPWTGLEERELDQEFQNRYGGKWFLQSRNQPAVRARSRDDVIRQLSLDPQKKIVAVFSHILWDANLFFGEDLFEDYSDWFVQTLGAACRNSEVNWVIKLHPANVWKRAREQVKGELAEIALIRKAIEELPSHVKLLHPDTDISTLSLFQAIDYGVTVRGTVGIELPCFGVPTFTAGTGRYSGLGFTVDSRTPEEYLDKMKNIHRVGRMTPEQTILAKRHAYGIFRLRPWPMRSFRSEFNYLKKGAHPLDHNLFLQAGTLEDIMKNGDLEKWSAWAEQTEKADYLNE